MRRRDQDVRRIELAMDEGRRQRRQVVGNHHPHLLGARERATKLRRSSAASRGQRRRPAAGSIDAAGPASLPPPPHGDVARLPQGTPSTSSSTSHPRGDASTAAWRRSVRRSPAASTCRYTLSSRAGSSAGAGRAVVAGRQVLQQQQPPSGEAAVDVELLHRARRRIATARAVPVAPSRSASSRSLHRLQQLRQHPVGVEQLSASSRPPAGAADTQRPLERRGRLLRGGEAEQPSPGQPT